MRHRSPRGSRRRVGRSRHLVRGAGRGALRVVRVLLVVALTALLVRGFVITPFSIPSGSMRETLHVGDRILVDRLGYRFGPVERGDVVVFDGTDTFGAVPGARERGVRDWLVRTLTFGFTGAEETDYVKRVIGIGGDRVSCCDDKGRLTVDGVPLDEPYLFPGDDPSELRFDIEVPDGRLWVMGDHRSDSRDSRAHLGSPGGGTVPEGDVVGRVIGIVWPSGRLGGLP